MKSVSDRFWDRVAVIPFHGCWEWFGGTANGYGNMSIGGNRWDRAHRVSWKMRHGEIPEGQCVLHRCDNPLCVNPDHLFLGTQSDNMKDMHAKGRFRVRFRGKRGLSPDQVSGIRAALASGEGQRPIARRFGISQTMVWAIAKGHSWREGGRS